MFSEYYIEIEPEHYIYDVYNDKSVCMLLIIANSYDFFLIGQPIFQGYYTQHHMKTSTIAFSPLSGLQKTIPTRAPIPTTVMKAADPPSFAQEYGGLIFLLLCVLFAAYFI